MGIYSLPDQTIRLDLSLTVPGKGTTVVSKKHSATRAAVAGAIGGAVLLALIAGGIFWYRLRQKQGSNVNKHTRCFLVEPFDIHRGPEHVSTAQNSNATLPILAPVRHGKNTNIFFRRSAHHPDSVPIPTKLGTSSADVPASGRGELTSVLGNEIEALRREVVVLRQNQVIAGDAPPLYYNL